MYDFIRVQYELGRISADKVMSYAPRYITAEEAEKIVMEGKYNG